MRLPSGDKLAVSLNSFEPGHGLPIGGVTARPFELCFEVSNVDEAVGELIGHAGSVLAALATCRGGSASRTSPTRMETRFTFAARSPPPRSAVELTPKPQPEASWRT